MSRASEHSLSLFFLCLLALIFPASALSANPRVVVVVSDDLEAYRAPTEAFLTELGQQPRVYNLHGRRAEADLVVKQLRASSPEVIFCVGAKAAYAIKQGLPDTPVVYTAILNPRRHGLTGENITGVTMTVEPVTFLSQFAGFFPDATRIGVIRGPDTTDQRMLAMEAAAVELDKQLAVQQITNAREIRRAFVELTRQDIDALWLPLEITAMTTSAYRALSEEVRRRHLPLLVEMEGMVEAGGLFTMAPEPSALGRQAAGLVRRILDEGDVGRPEPPEKVLVVLNTRTLDAAGLSADFDPLLLDFVDKVID